MNNNSSKKGIYDKDIYTTIMCNDMRWADKKKGNRIPIERLPEEHWLWLINAYSCKLGTREIVIQFREAMLKVGKKRDIIFGSRKPRKYPRDNHSGNYKPSPNSKRNNASVF